MSIRPKIPHHPLAWAKEDAAPLQQACCLNCGAPQLGPYCHACGQPFREGRLTLRSLWRDVAAPFFQMDRGLLRTLRDMLVNPGRVIRRYVDGQRRRYVNPFTYLFGGAAASLISFSLLHDAFTHWVQQTVAASAARVPQLLPPEKAELFAQLDLKLAQYNAYTMLLIALPFALLLRLFFKKQQINLAESFVFALFCFGHVLFLNSVSNLTLVHFISDFRLLMLVSLGLYPLVIGYAAVVFFRERPVLSTLKALSAFGLSYAGFSVLAGVILFGYVLFFT